MKKRKKERKKERKKIFIAFGEWSVGEWEP